MTPETILAVLVVLAAIIGAARILLWQARSAPAERSRPWRIALLLLLQAAGAALLYLTLLPPRTGAGRGRLTVATRNTPATALLAGGQAVVALPEASVNGGERFPDLATALRRHPSAALHVLGDGLEARDLTAAAAVPLTFEAPSLRGIVRLDVPARVAPGSDVAVSGRVSGLAGGSVDLLDPSGKVAATMRLPESGEFALHGATRVAGTSLFTLRARNSAPAVLERAAVPVWTVDEKQPRMLLLAGAPGPEVKYLRRWAVDAGVALQAQFPAGGGIQLGDRLVAISGPALRNFDVAVVDERSWVALSAGERAALIGAVRGGLGLLLRVTGPVPDAVRRDWRSLGFGVSGGDATAPLGAKAETGLNRVAARVGAARAVPLRFGGTGLEFASFRAVGRGRVALTTVIDSFALALQGDTRRHGEFWSRAITHLARPADARPQIDALPRPGERMTICGLRDGASVLAPDGRQSRLLLDPASRLSCAAFWPQRSGWHTLRAGGAPAMFYVWDANDLPGVRAAKAAEATAALASRKTNPPEQAAAGNTTRGSSWPWFVAWLLTSGLLWWFERARFGRARPQPQGAD